MMFIVEMVIFCVFLVALVFAPNYFLIVVCLFAIGLALGCDYPTAHMIISESIPSLSRGKLVLGAFAFQAIGALGGTAVGYGVLSDPARVVRLALDVRHRRHPGRARHRRPRFYIVESANWLAARGQVQQAEQSVRRLLRRKPQYPDRHQAGGARRAIAEPRPRWRRNTSFAALFNKTNRRATILASVPWFLQDLGTYGIGIFTPTILAAAVGSASHDHARSVIDIIHNDIVAAEGSALITALLIVGIAFAVDAGRRGGPHPAAGAGLHRLRDRDW